MADNELARQRRCVEQIHGRWPTFLAARQAHLRSHSVGHSPAEKVAENILCDLFTKVLDWTTEQVRLQENRVDLLITRLGIKYLILEAKRPGSLDGPASIDRAIGQACRYATAHNVNKIAVSDGCVLRAYDLTGESSPQTGPSLRPRISTHLADTTPPSELWWLSTRGIYRIPNDAPGPKPPPSDDTLLHTKYRLPARCFAFIGDPQRPSTWKLPYLRLDGTVDERRLPKAIQSVLRDYRGEQVHLPEEHVPDVLTRLAHAAHRKGRMPHQDPTPAPTYQALHDALIQMGRPGATAGPDTAGKPRH